MPNWGLSMTEGTITNWLRAENEDVEKGDEIAEIETTKLTGVYEAHVPGTIRKIVAPKGSTRPVGSLIGVMADADVSDEAIAAFIAGYVDDDEAAGDMAGQAASSRTVSAGGAAIHAVTAGDGSGLPIVLLHGFGGNAEGWSLVQAQLAQDRKVVAIDLPGHGRSGKLVPDGGYAAVAGVIGDALDALGIERFHLCGHSYGGAVAAALADLRPSSVAALCLVAPAGFGSPVNRSFLDSFRKADDRKAVREALEMLFADDALASRAMIADTLGQLRIDGARTALDKIAEMLIGGDRAADVDPQNTLFVWGSEDRVVPLPEDGRLPAGAALQVIESSGHMPQAERAGEFIRRLSDFIQTKD